MSVVNIVNATCPKCLTKNDYCLVISWNSIFGEKPTYENKCKNCGYLLQYEDTEPMVYHKSYRNIFKEFEGAENGQSN